MPGPFMFGKIPTEGDFLRVGASPLHEALDEWVSRAILSGRDAGIEVAPAGSAPLNFVLCLPDQEQVAVGTLTPSHDRVGRKFPLVIFQTLDVATIRRRWSGLARATRPFRREARDLTRDLDRKTRGPLLEDVRRLEPVDADVVLEARAELDALVSETTLDRATRRTYGLGHADLGAAQLAFGVYTLSRVFSNFGRREEQSGRVLLDLPAVARGDGGGVDLWTALLGRGLRWSRPPSMIWNGQRLIVALGTAPPELLRLMAAPGAGAGNLWPVSSDNRGVLVRVQASLDPDISAVLSRPDAPLSELWFRLARGPRT